MSPLDIFLNLLYFFLGIFHVYPPKAGVPKPKDKTDTEKETKSPPPPPVTTTQSSSIVTSPQLIECPESKRTGHDKAVCHLCTPPPPRTTTQHSVHRPLSISTTQASFPPATSTGGSKNVITPSESEVRGYWIDRLKRAELEQALKRFSLSTEGNVSELKARLAAYFDEVLEYDSSQNTPNILEYEEDSGLLGYAGLPPATTVHSDIRHRLVTTTNVHTKPRVSMRESTEPTFNQSGKDLDLVKEILGLPPHVSTDTMVQSLIEIKNKNTTRETQRAPLPYSASNYELPHNAPPMRSSYGLPTNVASDDLSQLCNTLRKWNLRYEGGKDTVAFLERLQELIEAYGVNRQQLLKALPELFKGNALLWYRNNREYWRTFEDFLRSFKQHFLPPGYEQIISDEINKRTQGEYENFRSYVTAITTLMRRQGGFSKFEQLNQIYKNMKPDYKLTIRRDDFADIDSFTKLAEGYETYLRERESYRPPPNPSHVLTQDTAYYPNNSNQSFAAATKPFYSSNERKSFTRHNKMNKSKIISKSKNEENYVNKPDPTTSVDPPSYEQKPIYSQTYSPSTENKGRKPDLICFNCEKKGHRYEQCRFPKVLKCFYCKTVGVRTTQCNCRSGN